MDDFAQVLEVASDGGLTMPIARTVELQGEAMCDAYKTLLSVRDKAVAIADRAAPYDPKNPKVSAVVAPPDEAPPEEQGDPHKDRLEHMATRYGLPKKEEAA